jgi:hypothetical protein
MSIEQLFLNRIVSGLRRKSITSCSKWAEAYRVINHQPWSFRLHPWQRAMHDSDVERNVGQKAAQMGYTDTALNFCLYSMDMLGKDVLYVLPSKTPDAGEFSAGRFDQAVEYSPHLANFFSDVKNVGHKRAGSTNFYLRGSHKRSQLKSLPVGRLVLDEVDEMTQANIPLAFERLSGQRDPRHWLISTPTAEGVGINEYFQESSQNHFFFSCPHCNKFIELDFPRNLVVTAESVTDPLINKSHLICHLCNNKLLHKAKPEFLSRGEWVASHPERSVKGWYINQLYSSADAGKPRNLAKRFLRSLSNKSDEQEFYNSTLGKPHVVEGADVTDTLINQTIGSYPTYIDTYPPNKIITMGVDQGTFNHFVISAWTIHDYSDISANSHSQVLIADKVRNFEDLDQLMSKYNVYFCVIDAQPERRKANEFANRFPGRVRLCWYPEGIHTKQIHVSDSGNEPSISVDRTTWLDTSLGRFFKGKSAISLPINISLEYREHLKSLKRIYKKDKNGNPIGRYVTANNKPDHLAHAQNYCEIALTLAASTGRVTNITGVY